MADPISLASGLVALTTFALQSSQALYQVINSFRSSQKTVRGLKEEIEALVTVLISLQQTVASDVANLGGLSLPLLRCGKACCEFEVVVVKCAEHSGGPRTSFRDWLKLTYMGDDITGFKDMLAGYKSTIAIAIGDANIRTSTVTIGVLKQYKEMVANTTSDLNDRLQEINDKLHNLSSGLSNQVSSRSTVELEKIRAEKESTVQCLLICAQVSEHLDQAQPPAIESSSTASDARHTAIETVGEYLSARRKTSSMLSECKEKLSITTSELKRHLEEMNQKLKTLSHLGEISAEQTDEQARIYEEKTSTEQCLHICTEAAEQAEQFRTNIVEDVSAEDEAYQVVVATLGDLISAKRITAGARSTQWMGQMSDTSLQHLSRDRSHALAEMAIEPRSEAASKFVEQHGLGYKLDSAQPGDNGA